MSHRRSARVKAAADTRRAWLALSVTVIVVVTALTGDAQRGAPRPGRGHTNPAPPRPALVRGEAGLVRAYDAILDARFDEAETELARACGAAPPEACKVLGATAQWWRILVDPDNRTRDAAFSTAVDEAITSTAAWTVRVPQDAEAWFYLGAAYAARAQWRVLRGETLAAARDGSRIKEALERALAFEPAFEDAYFGIGLYKYYAGVAPTAAKVLRFLLMLPGGNKAEGLAQMLRARDGGRLLRGEADYQLHLIYLWYERAPQRALALLAGLRRQYPGNPLFLAATAEIEDTYLHDITASLASWRALLALAREQRVNVSPLAEAQARLGAARQLEALQRTDEAIALLEGVVARRADAPYGALAQAYLRLGEAHDRLGARAAARGAYRDAIAAAPRDDPHRTRERATTLTRRTPDRKAADAYRLSLEGWRHFEQDDLAAAVTALEASLAFKPQDAVAHYRLSRALRARKEDDAALRHLELALRHAGSSPPPILGEVYLDAGQLYERDGRREQALSAYRRASTLFGAAADTRRAAAGALQRLDK